MYVLQHPVTKELVGIETFVIDGELRKEFGTFRAGDECSEIYIRSKVELLHLLKGAKECVDIFKHEHYEYRVFCKFMVREIEKYEVVSLLDILQNDDYNLHGNLIKNEYTI